MKHKAGLRTGRRQFLKSMAGMAVAAPLVIPGSALGADGRVSANERIVLGHIGMGWFGTIDLKMIPLAECPTMCCARRALRSSRPPVAPGRSACNAARAEATPATFSRAR
jgi:hypothetical protein